MPLSPRLHQPPLTVHLIYLHGFASSPQSSKALFLRDRLAARGLTLHCPDLNEPDFSTLTTTRMIAQVERLIDRLGAGPVMLFGSSLGAFVALHVAERAEAAGVERGGPRSPAERLVLLAPAFDFGTRGMTGLGPDELERWRVTDRLEVEHYAEGGRRVLRYALYADAQRYDSFATRASVPTLILQGRQDVVVDPAMVERFAASRPHVTLRMLDDDHQLKGSLETIWQEVSAFLPPE